MAGTGGAADGHGAQAAQDAEHLRLAHTVQQFTEEDGTVVLELAVDDDDYGKVIGRGGRTANALRTVVKAAAVRENKRVLVDIVE